MKSRHHKLMSPVPSAHLCYWLVAGEVVFTTPDPETGEIVQGAVRCNAIVSNTTNTVPTKLMARAQQSLQAMFFQRHLDPAQREAVKVVDVFLYGMSALGRMSREDFEAMPEHVSGLGEIPATADALAAKAPLV